MSGEDRKLSQKEAEENNRRCLLGAQEMASGSTAASTAGARFPLGGGYLVRRQCLSTSESLQCFDVRSALSSSKTGKLGTPRVTDRSDMCFDGL